MFIWLQLGEDLAEKVLVSVSFNASHTLLAITEPYYVAYHWKVLSVMGGHRDLAENTEGMRISLIF